MADDGHWYVLESIAVAHNGGYIRRLLPEDWQNFEGGFYCMMAEDAYLTNNTSYHPRTEHAQYQRNLQPVQGLDAACIKLSPVTSRVITPTAPRLRRLTHTSDLPAPQHTTPRLSR